ncbi:hypothetical protein [Paenibacillus glucanolyticus]|uniref:hypothetical protein n=1 Tax=Paenibacillus glucanolyticus TaxID=59843 RepID=UPI00096CA57C|nr:hypothetical protein [Paenibacillus glucanolyticus]OMF76655.1 hypothetical protein BK142_14115 [Paenibacillus glucanolyticus]
MKGKETWRDLLLMAGYEVPKEWSGHKCKKVTRSLATEEFEKYLPEMTALPWAISKNKDRIMS